ncbi:MAG: hypothetical protein ABSD98_19555 [Candidatus Korobacteraceae bacterium]|jgi:hypothetical protein
MFSSLFRKPFAKDEFPAEFKIQRVGLAAAKSLADLQPAHIAAYFRDHPEQAKDLLQESYDKRFTPSSFITEDGGRYLVGWISRRAEWMCVKSFSNLADAATDYLLFSLGKGRWKPPETTV